MVVKIYAYSKLCRFSCCCQKLLSSNSGFILIINTLCPYISSIIHTIAPSSFQGHFMVTQNTSICLLNELYLPRRVTLTRVFLVGADLKSTLHLYMPASSLLMSSTTSVAGEVLRSKQALSPNWNSSLHLVPWFQASSRAS